MPKIIDYTRTPEAEYLRQILQKNKGEKLFIPRATKYEVSTLTKRLLYCAERLHINNIKVEYLYRSNSWWVELEHKAAGVVYIKLPDGSVRKETIDPERFRLLHLLIEDGNSLEQINEIVDPPTTIQELTAVSPLSYYSRPLLQRKGA